MSQPSKEARLATSDDMEPVHGTVDVDIPIETLWECFIHANSWPRWNRCFYWAYNRDLTLGQQLIWCFQPIRWWYLYKMPAIAKIVEVEEQRKVTWEVTALPGFYARHTYHMQDLGNGRTRFGSWEQATGWSFRLMKRFWIAHFVFVKDRSLEGARRLEAIYQRTGRLDEETLPQGPSRPSLATLLLLLLLVTVGAVIRWFYTSYVRQQVITLAPGVHAILNGGGNSLVVQGDGDVLLVDPKFPPNAKILRRWIERNIRAPVTKIVNTHYHYDHTQGNYLYPNAQIIAHKNAPGFMLDYDKEWWSKHPSGLPTQTIKSKSYRLNVGPHGVILTDPGVAHTASDLWVHLPQHNIIATGDLVFHTHYPFFDTSVRGASIPGMIKAIRELAAKYPNATFVPGHGPLASASDLQRYADYLEFLYKSVERHVRNGRSKDETVKAVKLSDWRLSILPSFHKNKLSWATAKQNVRWVYCMLTDSAT